MTQGQEWYSHGICAQIQFMTVMKKKKDDDDSDRTWGGGEAVG